MPTLETAQETWARGFGVIRHAPATRERIQTLAARLEAASGLHPAQLYDVLAAADRIASAAMWLVVHETYARNVYLDGRALAAEDFKPDPQGHTGGSLNMVPAYAGYMAANTIGGGVRAWLMGQGHCVAAVDSVNLLLGNITPAHAQRYGISNEGLTRYVRDFYSYALDERGRQDSPLGSHVNAHTAGGLAEGGYLGFAELQYVHMPLPGESLVAFLSDGAFEEQRGSDWASRWWRADDSGVVVPIMINNGRRIDQRTTMSQSGGVTWLKRHLRLNGFDPMVFDGRDPAAFVWAIFEAEHRLAVAAARIREGKADYPVKLPYGIAVSVKGYGFYGAGTNLAHNLPLGGNPAHEPKWARTFNRSARRLWVAPDELESARALLGRGDADRPLERDNALATRSLRLDRVPSPGFIDVGGRTADPASWKRQSPMAAIDAGFLAAVEANPHLRPRVGNPDEMKSNRMLKTLDALKFRVTAPEKGVPEAITGAVITALNEEAVIGAALANKGGINITVTYEAFGVKMLGLLRQEIIFAQHCARAGRRQEWLSIPLILTSHTWENSKNEQSHQDPTLAEALLGEARSVSRVLFPADHNSAAEVISRCFQTRGQFWTLVVSKSDSLPVLFTAEESKKLLDEGALRLEWAGHRAGEGQLVIAAIGSYQLLQALRASRRLAQRQVAHSLVYIIEPGRFAAPRSPEERAHAAPTEVVERLFPAAAEARLFITHTRPEPLLGALRPLDSGARTTALGYINEGGTLDVDGLLHINRSTWAHCVAAAGRLLDVEARELLEPGEIDALEGRRSPAGVLFDGGA
jgi:phosphoketolase